MTNSHSFTPSVPPRFVDEPVERRPMDVPLLVSLAAAGMVLGLLSVYGALAGSLELVAWGTWTAGAAIAALRRIPDDAFRHVAFGGVLAGFLSGDMKVLQLARYLENHPELLAIADANGGIATVPRTALVISDILTGVLFGMIGGLLALYFRKRFPSAASTETDVSA